MKQKLKQISYLATATLLLHLLVLPISAGAITWKAIQDINSYKPWYDKYDILCEDAGGDVSIPDGSIEQNGKAMFDFLVSKGLKPFQAAGVLGNMMVESGWQPQRLQGTRSGVKTPADEAKDSGSGWGIVQWTPAGKFIKTQNPINKANDLGVQINFVWDQLEGRTSIPEKEAGNDLKNTTNIRDAVLAFQGNRSVGGKYRGYERPADQSGSVNLRVNYAKGALAKFGSGASTIDPSDPLASISANDSVGCNPEGGAEGASKTGFVWPISKGDYGGMTNCWRKPTSSRDGHTGVDFKASVGTEVLAAKDGTIASYGGGSDSGNYIIIKHADNQFTNYQHLSRIIVKTGPVKAGQHIADSGNTGFSTGPHLHFSVTTQGGLDSRKSVSYSVNPMDYLPTDRSSDCKPS